ncbi:phenylalanine--tRNA ligase, mitochondrial [Neocloeon triangulifer]|uniref:phenylalanine--tRNA ligase, mitochondrial n=1 Tax=Neocloeon triangulifer TaxID=2078957 RepID=UPI00286F6669|nr:phenylalanine--tRNA ligase, mitochondrial [Neocloeon triangulifer]
MLELCLVRCSRVPKGLAGQFRAFTVAVDQQESIEVCGRKFARDQWTNATPKILSHVGRNLHLQEKHPLGLLKTRIVNHFYSQYISRTGNPIFSVFDRLSPVVTVEQNFDSLLVPKDHISRSKSDCYYLDAGHLLRGHTTAHQADLIKSGLDAYLTVGDVYRRDEIDSSHYPVFHQLDAARLYSKHEIYKQEDLRGIRLFENGEETPEKQDVHTLDTALFLQNDLKVCLERLARNLFGEEVDMRWVDSFFPFTHPSFELEVHHNGKWIELLGCGVTKQEILANCGITDKVGWAFGLGLERLAMCLYQIPDIRLFWSKDSGFVNQFRNATPTSKVIYKTVSVYPQCTNDVSFWLPEETEFSPNDFYDLVRDVGGDIIEQVTLVDEFTNPKTKRTSHCYRIIYRHMEKTLTKTEVNEIHEEIKSLATQNLGITLR